MNVATVIKVLMDKNSLNDIRRYVMVTSWIVASLAQSPSFASYPPFELRNAIISKNDQHVERILKAHPSAANIPIFIAETQLHTAALQGTARIVELLIRHGAHVNATDDRGKTPLFFAIQHGAHVHVRNNQVRILALKRGEENTEEAIAICNALIRNNANLNCKIYRHELTILQEATRVTHSPELIRFLLDAGAKPTANERGTSPIHIAAEMGKTALVEVFLDVGVDIETKTNRGYTALHTACQRGHVETVRFLLRRGANIDARTYGPATVDIHEAQTTPLHLACWNGHVAVVKFLLKNDAIQEKDAQGATPLDRAISRWICEGQTIFIHVPRVVHLLIRFFTQVSDENVRRCIKCFDYDPLQIQFLLALNFHTTLQSEAALPNDISLLVIDYLCSHSTTLHIADAEQQAKKVGETPIAWLFQQLRRYWERTRASNQIRSKIQEHSQINVQ